MSASTRITARGSGLALRHSLRTRLPLLISSLVMLVLAAFVWTAYREVDASLVRTAMERARAAADQLAGLLERSAAQGNEQLNRLASDPSIRGCLRDANPVSCDAARGALAPIAIAGPRRISLWNVSGQRVLAIDVRAADGSLPIPESPRPSGTGTGPLQTTGSTVFLDSVAEVTDGSTRLGLLDGRTTVAITPPGILSRMAGQDAVVGIGNVSGDVWTDLSKVVPAPRTDLARDTTAEYRAANGVAFVGAGRPIRGTPWAAWVTFPRPLVTAPARTFLRQMIGLALLFGLVAALLVRALTTRITTPLTVMTEAAEAIASGHYSQRVPADRDDEIGRLGAVFNTMTAQIEEVYRRLEERVRDRNRELNDALRALAERGEAREAYLASVVETSDEAIVGMTTDGIVQSWNRGAQQLYGRTAEEMIGRSISAIIPPDVSAELPELLDRLRHGEHIRGLETVRLDRDGTPIDVSITMSPIIDAAGQILGISTVTRDVRDRKKLEEQLRQSQKMEAIGQLAGGVAHDFNNLLTAILGYGALLVDSFDADDPRRLDVQEIVHAGQRAAGLTRQLLAFSRKQVLQTETVNLNTLVSDTSQMLRRLIGEHIEFDTRLAPDLATIRADPTQLQQILLNLAVNARDAMPEGGRLTIETANVQLDDSYALRRVTVRPGPYVMLAVSDTGIGMSDETQRRLFEPFFTTKERGRGTGLGLATVYGIVKQSNGYIWVYSEPGHGATFKVYLPHVPAGADVVEPRAAVERPAAGSETVLLVEDEQAVRYFARALLERAGYRVFEAESPIEADAIFESHADSIDILVTDVIMPGSTGPALFKRLTARRPRLKVLYMSGYTDDTIVQGGHLGPDVPFVQKPFAGEGLIRKVREVLDRAS